MNDGTTSLWKGTSTAASFPALSGEVEADVAIVGGGITGITAAALLSREGKRVVVLESMQVGCGTTGHSTGNLYSTVDDGMHQITKQWDRETARVIARARARAIDSIERLVAENDIPCGFVRRPQFLYRAGGTSMAQLEEEYRAVKDAEIPASLTEDVPLPYKVGKALRLENQAQFHPLIFVMRLAEIIRSDQCRIFENSKVVEMDDGNGAVVTRSGKVRAQAVLVATHVPKGFDPVQTELGPYREYGMAGLLEDDRYPDGIFWSMEEPPVSLRSYETGGKRYLILIGEKHKTGQHRNDTDYFGNVERFARSHFRLSSIEYRWSAQHYRPADGLPYMGKSLIANRYIATGFGTNGLVYGPLAAALITDQILGRDNPLGELLKPTRFTPVKSAKDFLKENLNVARYYAKDYLAPGDLPEAKDVGPGEGGLAEIHGKTVAVYRDAAGTLTVLSPVCTHLGCKVHWNRWEKSWDCPCHGTRFSCDGEVLEGPAISPLKRIRVGEE